jgi:hypothetical protein
MHESNHSVSWLDLVTRVEPTAAREYRYLAFIARTSTGFPAGNFQQINSGPLGNQEGLRWAMLCVPVRRRGSLQIELGSLTRTVRTGMQCILEHDTNEP